MMETLKKKRKKIESNWHPGNYRENKYAKFILEHHFYSFDSVKEANSSTKGCLTMFLPNMGNKYRGEKFQNKWKCFSLAQISKQEILLSWGKTQNIPNTGRDFTTITIL